MSGLVHELPERDQDESDGDIHTGIPPDIERTVPVAPFVRPIVFPTRESPLLNVRILSLVATTHEREERLPERVDTFVLVVLKFPDNVVILAVFVAMLDSVVLTRPEREAIFPVAVARFELMVESDPVMDVMFEFIVLMLPVIAATVPLRAFCARRFVK